MPAPTPQQYLDSLVEVVSRFAASILTAEQPEPLLYALVTIAAQPDVYGLVVSSASAPVAGTVVHLVSPRVLTDLQYASPEDYQAALSDHEDPFVHPEDAEVVDGHIRHRSSAPYTARLRRGVGMGPNVWLRMQIQGWTLSVPLVGDLRLTMLAIAP